SNPSESMIYLETERVDAKQRRMLERALDSTMADVRAAVADWPTMRERLHGDADSIADAEAAALLHWFADGMLTLLGQVTRRRDGSQSQASGICRKGPRALVADDTLERAFAWFERRRGKAPGLLVIKANRLSRVHRRVPLDLFIVPVIDGARVTALSVHAGVWTSAALATPPDEVPLLRRQLAAQMAEHEFQPGSHDAKALVHALTVLPHDIMIGFSEDDVARVATAMMSLADRPRPRLALVMAPLKRHLVGFAWFSRHMLSSSVRLQTQAMLEEATGADTLDWSRVVEGGNLAMLRYVFDFRGRATDPDEDALDAQLQD